ncbi:hypothetical protein MesoLj113b_73360 (plasmid) [Mesorhizobium sp. 113-3-3]|nr:hypothetical protein MesoLj113b_73360 [Mesorhizobium sp. 113-3-3]
MAILEGLRDANTPISRAENEGQLPSLQNLCYRKDKLSSQIDIEHREIQCLGSGGIQRLCQGRDRACDLTSQILKHALDEQRYAALVFDHKHT